MSVSLLFSNQDEAFQKRYHTSAIRIEMCRCHHFCPIKMNRIKVPYIDCHNWFRQNLFWDLRAWSLPSNQDETFQEGTSVEPSDEPRWCISRRHHTSDTRIWDIRGGSPETTGLRFEMINRIKHVWSETSTGPWFVSNNFFFEKNMIGSFLNNRFLVRIEQHFFLKKKPIIVFRTNQFKTVVSYEPQTCCSISNQSCFFCC